MEDEFGNPIEPAEPTAAEPVEPAEPAEPAPAPEGDEPAEPAAEPAPKENKVQKRIDEITRARRQAEQEADYWRKVATGEIAAPRQEPAAPVVIPGLPAKPVLDNFEDYDQYVEALGEWSALKTLAERDYKAEQAKAQQAQKAVEDSHLARVEAARERYPDMEEVFALAPEIAIPPQTYEAILDSDQSADIGYHLAKNPAEAQRIIALPLVQQIKEIARLEMKFKDAPAVPVKRVSKAPTPLNPLGGEGTPPKAENEMSDEEWIAHERARLAKLGRKY